MYTYIYIYLYIQHFHIANNIFATQYLILIYRSIYIIFRSVWNNVNQRNVYCINICFCSKYEFILLQLYLCIVCKYFSFDFFFCFKILAVLLFTTRHFLVAWTLKFSGLDSSSSLEIIGIRSDSPKFSTIPNTEEYVRQKLKSDSVESGKYFLQCMTWKCLKLPLLVFMREFTQIRVLLGGGDGVNKGWGWARVGRAEVGYVEGSGMIFSGVGSDQHSWTESQMLQTRVDRNC
jgi:hypothetical protein